MTQSQGWRLYLPEPVRQYTEAAPLAVSAVERPGIKAYPRAVVRMERSGRGGKEVTVVEHLEIPPKDREVWVKALKAALRQRQIGRLTIKKRGVDVVPEQLRKRLELHGENESTLVLTRVAGHGTAYLVQAF